MKKIKKGFASDNHSGVHPEILEALIKSNFGHSPSYDTDPYTISAKKKLKEHFGKKIDSYFVFNGTGANVCALRAISKGYQSVICSSHSHVFLDECASPEVLAHCKLLPIESSDGKLSIPLIKPYLKRGGDQHYSQPVAISIAQPNEFGQVYTLEEIKELSQFAKENNLLFHVDGARFVNAAAHLNCSLRELSQGIDVLSFGGTKNGLAFGEAVIFFNPELSHNFRFIRKQLLQLPSKSRFIASQFERYLTNDLCYSIAYHVNELAQYLAKKLSDLPEIRITQKVQSNSVFAIIPKLVAKQIKKEFFFYIWNPDIDEVRLIMTFDLTKEDIDHFINLLGEILINNYGNSD